MGGSLRGEEARHWQGGRGQGPSGYTHIYSPGHPRAHGLYVFEHILIAEKALGRTLPRKHPVHHVDEDVTNKARGNLVICEDQAYHSLLHQRQRAFDACGNADALRCVRCKQYDRQDDMYRIRRPSGNRYGVHRDCHEAYLKLHRRVS